MLLTRLSFWIWHLFWINFEFSNAWWNDRKKWKKRERKNRWVENLKRRLISKKKKGLSWKPERAAQLLKNLDEWKTQKDGSIWEGMISLKWVETWSGDSVWKVEMGDLKGKVEKWVRRILLTLSFFRRQGENGSLGIFRKTKDISQRLDWMTLWKFSAYDCQHVYCGIPPIPL